MKRTAVVALAIATLATAATASATWTAAGSGTASARATTLGAGNTPSTTVAGRKVNLSWNATSFGDGTAASGYTLRRYSAATGGSVVASLFCPSTTCSENPVPPGTWYYGVTPAYGTWTGTEGATRGSATVGSPSLALTPTTFDMLPKTLSGTIANFIDGETLTFRLDNATTGTVLSATPATVPTGGSSAVTVTIPTGTAIGAHTVYAVGSLEGSVPPASLSVTYSPAATLTLSPNAITSFPATLMGAVANFGTSESVSFRLDDATTGTLLAMATADGAGSASGVSMLLRCATNGTHTVYAVSASRTASATFTVSDTFCPLSLALANKTGGTAGLAEQGDTVVVDYSETLKTTTLCSSFTGPTLAGAAVLITTGAANAVVVDGPSGQGNCTMHFGSIGLGSRDFNTGPKDVKFEGSTLAWDGTTRRLTITLGVLCLTGSCGTPSTVVASNTATYTPDPLLTTTASPAVGVSSTAVRTGVHF